MDNREERHAGQTGQALRAWRCAREGRAPGGVKVAKDFGEGERGCALQCGGLRGTDGAAAAAGIGRQLHRNEPFTT